MHTKSLDILVIGTLPPPICGMTLISKRMVEYLSCKHNVTVVAVEEGGMGGHIRKLVSVWRGLIKIIEKKRQCMWIYLPVDSGLGMFYTMLFVFMAYMVGSRVILHHHSFQYIDEKDWRMSVIARMLKGKSIHVMLCKKMIRGFKKIYGQEQYVVQISNLALMGLPEVGDLNREMGNEIRIGLLSNLCKEKGLDVALALFEELRNRGLPVRLLLAGPCRQSADQNKIYASIEKSNNCVEYRGAVYGEEKEKFFRDIDVFIFPTLYKVEAEPLVLYEAMAFGVPVIANGKGCIRSQVDSNCGYIVDKDGNFINESVEFLQVLFEERLKYRKLAISSRQRVENELNVALEGLSKLEISIGSTVN